MSERKPEPIFCSECQNEVSIDKARVLDGKVLCPNDLAQRSLFERLRARKLPENARRRSGGWFRGMFTSLAALMLVIGVAFIVKQGTVVAGVALILASIFMAFFAVLAADAIDVMLDIHDQLRRLNRR